MTFTLAQKAIVADPAQLSFTQQQQGEIPPPQTIQVTANAPSTFTVEGASSWIKVTPASGSAPATLSVSVDPAGLPPGIASGSFQITGPDNQLSIPVSLTVAQPPSATPAPTSLTFTYQVGSPPPEPQTVSVASTGDEVSFTAAASTESGANWLTVTPASGSTPATLTVGVEPAMLVPGKHTGSITITTPDASGGPGVTASVSVSIQVTTSPASVQALLNGATLAPTPVAPGQIVTITGTGLGPGVGISAVPTDGGSFRHKPE